MPVHGERFAAGSAGQRPWSTVPHAKAFLEVTHRQDYWAWQSQTDLFIAGLITRRVDNQFWGTEGFCKCLSLPTVTCLLNGRKCKAAVICLSAAAKWCVPRVCRLIFAVARPSSRMCQLEGSVITQGNTQFDAYCRKSCTTLDACHGESEASIHQRARLRERLRSRHGISSDGGGAHLEAQGLVAAEADGRPRATHLDAAFHIEHVAPVLQAQQQAGVSTPHTEERTRPPHIHSLEKALRGGQRMSMTAAAREHGKAFQASVAPCGWP